MAMQDDTVCIDSDTTVEELALLWLTKEKRPSVRPQTYEVYEDRVNCHLIPYLGSMRVADVRGFHVVDVVNRHGYASKEANKRLLSTIRSIFEWGVNNEVIRKSPIPSRLTVKGTASREDKPLTPNQTKALLDYCRADKKPDVYLFTHLALVTGMRRSEIAALRWDCVDFQNGMILVRRNMVDSTGEITDELKTEAAKRDIPISPATVALLKRVRAESTSTYVVDGRRDGHIESKDISRYSRVWNAAGVSPQKIHAHLFRKTFATRLIETGTDPKRVQYLLGHTTLEMTLQVYAKYDQESQTEKTRDIIAGVFENVL